MTVLYNLVGNTGDRMEKTSESMETNDLILKKGELSDWRDMYERVWSRPECARYMSWSLTTSEEDARERMKRTVAFQSCHHTFTVYEKAGGRAIGYAGAEMTGPDTAEECGICLGPEYMRKGYGRQIMNALMDRMQSRFGAKEFVYCSHEENTASIALARSLGFRESAREERIDERTGGRYIMIRFCKELGPSRIME